MKYREINIEETEWSSRHDIEEHIPFAFSFKGKDPLDIELKGVTLGNLNESLAIPVKAVRHDFMEEDGYRVDTSSVIPFGSEPYIARKFEYLYHIIKVTSDIRVKAPLEGNAFSVDELVLKGKWNNFAVVDKKLGPKLKWEKIGSKDSVLYDSDDLFGVLLFESDNGNRIEIGTGFDLWRWNIAEKDEGINGKIRIESVDGEIVVKRLVMSSDIEFEIPKRDWRFTWYFAWNSDLDMPGKEMQKDNIFKIDDFKWEESAKAKISGNFEPYPCFQSNAARNILRKWLRSVMNKSEGQGLILTGMLPDICDNPSHLDRPKAGPLLHWDFPDIIDFWFWANRQLRRKNSYLSILSTNDKIFSQLPSFIGMSKGKIED